MRLVYLSPVPLASFAQRPHHFVEWFHQRHDARVLWIDPGPTRLPRLSDIRRLLQPERADLRPLWRDQTWVESVRCRVLPLEPYAWGRAVNSLLWRPVLDAVERFVTPDTWVVLGKPCALSLELIRRYPQLPMVYDAMDYAPAFFQGVSKQWMSQAEANLAERVKWILASSTALAGRYARYSHKLRTVLNGLTPPLVDWIPPSGANRQRPVLGYIGTIGAWFDWSSVIRLAQAYPQMELRLIGPVAQEPDCSLPDNVRLLPAIAQHHVYEAMQPFHVGLIPFCDNELTAYVDPVKYYEYRALGLPVLSTRFGEMARRTTADRVYFFDQLFQGDLKLEQIMATPLQQQEIRAFRDANTWQRRFDAIDFFHV